MALILADSREGNGANPYLPASIAENISHNKKLSHGAGDGEIALKIAQISVGDYIIFIQNDAGETTLALIIERKTWKDLAASIKDGRMDKQCKEMQLMRDKYKCNILYIIEGAIKYTDDYVINGLPFKNLHAKLRHNVLRGIAYVHSKDEQHTAKVIVDFARDILKMYRSGELAPKSCNTATVITEERGNSDVIVHTGGAADIPNDAEIKAMGLGEHFDIPSDLKGRRPADDENLTLNIWTAIPGVTAKSAVILMQKYHISDIVGAFNKDKAQIKKDLAELRFDSGTKFGASKAEKIAELMYEGDDQLILARQKKVCIEILKQVPGISEETAVMILSQHTLKDICRGYVPSDTIAEMKKNNGRRIGKSSEKLCGLLRKSVVSGS